MLHFSVGFFIYKIVLDKVIVKDKKNKSVLFKGKHCFPLSPAPEQAEETQTKDQMNIILRKSGKMTKFDLSFIRSKDALEYI